MRAHIPWWTLFTWTLFTYAAMATAAVLAERRGWPRPECRAAGRAAWCAAWFAVSWRAFGRAMNGIAPTTDLAWGLAPAACVFAAAMWEIGRTSSRRRTVGWVLAAAACGLGAGTFVRIWERVGAAAAIVLGGVVFGAMRTHRWLGLRLAAYWASFVGTFAVLLPVSIAEVAAERRLVSIFSAWAGTAIVLPAILLAVLGTRRLVAAGGTPEPLDPPGRLSTEGLYARVRHPIQIAEILLVWTGAIGVGTRLALVYAAVFTVALVGPLRWLEERRLTERFGDEFVRYRRSVPAYFPRWPTKAERQATPL